MIPNKLPVGERVTQMLVKVPTKDGKALYKKYAVKIKTTNEYHYFLEAPFAIKDDLKAMKGARWMANDKTEPLPAWRVDNVRRNNVNIAYLEGINPFSRYFRDAEKVGEGFQLRMERKDYKGTLIKIMSQQKEMTEHMLLRRQCIISGEMGIGKTLSAIEAMELSLVQEIWYCAPKSALASVRLENIKWNGRSKIVFMTYEELVKTLKNWDNSRPVPRFVIYDESSRLKTPTSQRAQAAFYLAENMREAHGDDCYIVLMSGSPAPKSPLDWYWQCEIAFPGFIKEGDIFKFQRRLAIMEQQDDLVGHRYNKLIAWKDGNTQKCGFCAGPVDDPRHIIKMEHDFVPMPNEVQTLYKRMSGLVYVKFKKDCLDIPDKIYRVVNIKPSIDLMRAAKMVAGKARSAIESLTLLRELSDGFQYKEVATGSEICPVCNGLKVRHDDQNLPVPCESCSAVGEIKKTERQIVPIPSPKLDAVGELLEEMEEVGRFVIYAGFTGSIDRICEYVVKQNWNFIRVDGRGWYNNMNPEWDNLKMLQEFQGNNYDKIVFIAHPGSAGMGLTLTASPAICYYSNDFNAESRIQSEDRIHRAGMDVNRGATIIDLILLPTDQKVLDNLKRKRELQSISLGELQQAIDNYGYTHNA